MRMKARAMARPKIFEDVDKTEHSKGEEKKEEFEKDVTVANTSDLNEEFDSVVVVNVEIINVDDQSIDDRDGDVSSEKVEDTIQNMNKNWMLIVQTLLVVSSYLVTNVTSKQKV